MGRRILKIKDIVRVTGYSERMITRLMDGQIIPSQRIPTSKHRYCTREQLLAFLRTNNVPQLVNV